MLSTIRHRSHRKLPVLLLVFLLCVQSLGFVSHGLMMKSWMQAEVAEQSVPPCHDMPDMAMNSTHDNSASHPPCCDDGKCADSNCMMPAGTHFAIVFHDYFIAHSGNVLISKTTGISSTKPSPPIRPPIA
ncbi:MAG: CopL family metal-binding regulatory protein [Arenimonas sp.]